MPNKVDVYLMFIAIILLTSVEVQHFTLLGIWPTDSIKWVVVEVQSNILIKQ